MPSGIPFTIAWSPMTADSPAFLMLTPLCPGRDGFKTSFIVNDDCRQKIIYDRSFTVIYFVCDFLNGYMKWSIILWKKTIICIRKSELSLLYLAL